VYSVSTVFRLIQYRREGKQLNFHISRHIAHLGWETPVFFTFFTLSTYGTVVSNCFQDTYLIAHVRISVGTSIFSWKRNDYEKFEKRGIVEKRGKEETKSMRLCEIHFVSKYFVHIQRINKDMHKSTKWHLRNTFFHS
jgi:hypothetical protein